MPIQCDYHMHTPLCHHAAGPVEAYVEAGIRLGLREIGFSDHNPLPHGFGARVRMKESELDGYVSCIQNLRSSFRGRIDVLLGLEMDFVDGLEGYLEKQIAAYPWDYIIGSIHYLDPDCRVPSWGRVPPENVEAHFARYFEQMRKLVRSGLCDILAHFDVAKRIGQPPPESAAGDITRTLEEIARAGLCMEINTSGYRHADVAVKEPYPGFPLIEQALAMGIPLTVNSDAHAPEQVGLRFGEIENFLRRKQCRQLARFEQRKPAMYDLA